MKDIRNLEKKITNYIKKNSSQNFKEYKLLDDAFSPEDIIEGIKVLLSKKITKGEITRKFEYEFAKFLGVKYALMVNSGSSANLISTFATGNPKMKNFLRQNSKFIIQSLCWSTSLWPIIQSGFKAKFVDVNIKTLNIDIDKFKKCINTNNISGAVIVHVLGCSSNIEEISNICKNKNIFLIEDTCESLGTKYNNKYLGTFGDFGTYSFYYSHQITSGEGGMIVCNDRKKYEIIHSLRSHGWDRGLNNKNYRSFNFINSGFNVRPTDVTAAIGLNQLRRLNKFISIRKSNREKIINKLKNSENWNNQFSFVETPSELKPSWFGLPILINNTSINAKKKFIDFLNKSGIETRPILSGNFMNQKSIKLYKLNTKKIKFNSAQEIDNKGFFIGIHTKHIQNKQLDYLTKKLLTIDKFYD